MFRSTAAAHDYCPDGIDWEQQPRLQNREPKYNDVNHHELQVVKTSAHIGHVWTYVLVDGISRSPCNSVYVEVGGVVCGGNVWNMGCHQIYRRDVAANSLWNVFLCFGECSINFFSLVVHSKAAKYTCCIMEV